MDGNGEGRACNGDTCQHKKNKNKKQLLTQAAKHQRDSAAIKGVHLKHRLPSRRTYAVSLRACPRGAAEDGKHRLKGREEREAGENTLRNGAGRTCGTCTGELNKVLTPPLSRFRRGFSVRCLQCRRTFRRPTNWKRIWRPPSGRSHRRSAANWLPLHDDKLNHTQKPFFSADYQSKGVFHSVIDCLRYKFQTNFVLNSLVPIGHAHHNCYPSFLNCFFF